MKIFLKIVKVIAYICSFLVGLLVIKLGFQSYQLIEHSMNINDYNANISVFFLAIILFTVGPSIIGTIVLLVYLIFLFPRSIKYINSLEKNPELCTKTEITKIVLFLIIIVILISTSIYVYVNVR